ncbi:hypothetical protein FRC06_003283, partial [Ceratobasidium sp. 370]
MSRTYKDARAALINDDYKWEDSVVLSAEQVRDRTEVTRRTLEMRALHCFSFWQGDNSVAILQNINRTRLKEKIELRGQVASLNGPLQYAAMAGEFYIPSFEYANIRIMGIEDIYVSEDNYYRDGEPRFCVETEHFCYVLIQPDFCYERNYAKMCADYPEYELEFQDVDWKAARPSWWKDLESWLEFKSWARKEGAHSDRRREDKSGD